MTTPSVRYIVTVEGSGVSRPTFYHRSHTAPGYLFWTHSEAEATRLHRAEAQGVAIDVLSRWWARRVTVLPVLSWETPLVLHEGGPFHPDLIAAWRAAGEAGPCARCGGRLEEGWCGPECPTCRREYLVLLGCRCGGTNLCPNCIRAGATESTRGEVVCEPNCSTLCPTCSPND